MEGRVVSLVPEGQAASFDMLVLGAGGGPLEDDLSAYWVKPKKQEWSEGFISLDGGSCLGALRRLLTTHPQAFQDFQISKSSAGSALLDAGRIYSWMASFLVTHAHWDHISGLVLSSGSGAGQKSVYGSKQTLENLSAAMNGGLWPILGSFEAKNGVPYVWRLMEERKSVGPSPGLSATLFPCSHGRHHSSTSYESSAFFVENEADGRSCLMFGDVEADSVSGDNTNFQIWQEAATRIRKRSLSSIFIECSYSSTRRRDQLYGHLSPPYIFEELQVLARLMPPIGSQAVDDLRGRLRGVNIGIVHVKDPTSAEEGSSREADRPERIKDKILRELLELENQASLGIKFVMLQQGMRNLIERVCTKDTIYAHSVVSHGVSWATPR